MSDDKADLELEQYARQLILPDIGDEGQEALRQSRLLVIGAGGLGVPILVNAAAAGFGHITIMDDDVIERTNLNRQFIYQEGDIGQSKAEKAALFAQQQNPHSEVIANTDRFSSATSQMVSTYDIIIDATDNPESRYLANKAGLAAKKPLIIVSAIRFEGQLSVFAPHLAEYENSPCYACLFPASPSAEQAPNCATVGILGAVTSLMGSWAALEAVKLVTNCGQPLIGELLLFDGLQNHIDKIITKQQPDCPICQSRL